LQAVKMSVGKRLKEERQRLKLSQEAFGQFGGVGKSAQINYEADARAPDTDYLSGIDAAGADVLYVVIGKRRIDLANTDVERGLLQQAIAYVLSMNSGADVSTAEAAKQLAQEIQARYDGTYLDAATGAHHPGTSLSEREMALIEAYSKSSAEGKKVIERIAELEAARDSSASTTSKKISVRGHGVAIGSNIQVGNVSVKETKPTKKR
jgi:transcriptional regulator with XRE-family HTH domain